jgi:Histidine kinase-, DNA gyrase B-, and HSP90-like ATPase
MTTTIDVSPRQDFWHRLCRTRPLRAVSEIVWNALDADASNVSVEFRLNPLGGLNEIVVSDDGSGIQLVENEEHRFAALGGSWKAKVQRTPDKRLMHGKFGEGRFRAFAIGGIVTWDTTFKEGNSFRSYEIRGTVSQPGKFTLSDIKAASQKKTGTIVTISNPDPSDGSLLSPDFSEHMSRVFAPYLLNYRSIKLAINGKPIDTKEIVARREQFDLPPISLRDGQELKSTLEIVEWRSINGRALYLCDENGFALSERAPEIRAPGFNFGAYLKSTYFSQLDEGALVDIDLADGMGQLLSGARDRLSTYFRQREREKTKALIESWKAEGVYPYPDAIESHSTEKARRVFDICAVTVHDYVDGFNEQNKRARALSFRLLKEAIESGSPELSRILSEVLLLPQNKQKEFSELLDKAKLTNIIDAVKDIETRIMTAKGLRALVCGADIRDSVKERDHIHRIVADSPWIFGEQFALGRSETGLTNLLREHLKLLKRDTRVTEPVLKAGGKSGRIDIMLAKLVKVSGRNDDNHLIIELKRANKKLGHKDFSQLLDYATSVIQDPRFDKTAVSWDFWLVGVETDDALTELCNAQDRPAGCAHIFKTGRAMLWIKTWGEILHDCLSRHEYVRAKLELEVEDEESTAYLEELYMKVVRPDGGPQS